MARRLGELVSSTGADELVVTNNVTDVDDRIRSHERIRDRLSAGALA